MKYLKTYLKSIIFYLVASLVLLETVLFLSGRYLLWQRQVGKKLPGAINIVCLGDSHTFGVGTYMRNSYPSQLERLLALNNPGKKFSVSNLGVPSSTTKRQVGELEDFFKEHEADAVIFLTGRNNSKELRKWRSANFKNPVDNKHDNLLDGLRSYRFFRSVAGLVAAGGAWRDENVYGPGYPEYIDFYLEKVRKVCRDKRARLVILSYYNSSDSAVRDFAFRHNLLYLDFNAYFSFLFEIEDLRKYVCPDMSHLNARGYKIFAEQLYESLFINQSYLSFEINPLTCRLEEEDLRVDKSEGARMIAFQKARVEKNKGTIRYPFELVFLGHIYTEIGREDDARDCYEKALLYSGCPENGNTVISPLINWYLMRGRVEEAVGICDKILLISPKNQVAKRYRDWIVSQGMGKIDQRYLLKFPARGQESGIGLLPRRARQE